MEQLRFKSLELEDREIFEKYFNEIQPEIAEYTFTNLFVWRHSGILEWAQLEERPIVLFTRPTEKYFLPPMGFQDNRRVLDLLVDYSIKNNFPFRIKKAPESYMASLNRPDLKVMEDRDNFDYVYRTEDLANLKGRKYDGKRGFVKKFKGLYKYEYVKFTPELVDCCLKLAEDWINQKDSQNKDLQDEFKAIQDTISYAETLGITGGFIRVNDETVAFTFGERLNRSTFIIHFEKANPKFIGSYQTINQLFAQNEVLGKYEFINREQDIGIESIRKSKLSYQPHRLVKKFIITL